MDMSNADIDSCCPLPWSVQSIFEAGTLSTRPVVRACWPTAPSAGEPYPQRRIHHDRALSGVRHGCRDGVGSPTGSAGGKRDFFGLSENPLRCDYRLCRSAKGIKSCCRDPNTIASIDGSKDGRTGLSGDNAWGRIVRTHDACKS